MEDYENAASDKTVSTVRIKKLDSLKNQDLITLAQQLKKRGVAGYQELLLDKLVEDIVTLNTKKH